MDNVDNQVSEEHNSVPDDEWQLVLSVSIVIGNAITRSYSSKSLLRFTPYYKHGVVSRNEYFNNPNRHLPLFAEVGYFSNDYHSVTKSLSIFKVAELANKETSYSYIEPCNEGFWYEAILGEHTIYRKLLYEKNVYELVYVKLFNDKKIKIKSRDGVEVFYDITSISIKYPTPHSPF